MREGYKVGAIRYDSRITRMTDNDAALEERSYLQPIA